MNVFSPSQSMNVFAQGANIGGNIRQAQTNAKLAPLVANGQYDQAAQVAGQRGDLGSAELYRSQYEGQLAQMGEQEKAAAAKRAEDLARVAVSLKGVPYEQRPVALQQQLPMLQAMGMDPQQIQGFDPSDQNLDAVLAQVTPLQELLKGPEYYAPVETESGYAQFSKDGSDPRQFEGIAPAPEGPMSPMGKLAADLSAGRITQQQYDMEIARLGKPATTVNVTTGGPGQPNPYANLPDDTFIEAPDGTAPLKGGQMWVVRNGRPTIVNAEGGDAAQAEEEAETKRLGRQASTQRAGRTVVREVGRGLELMPNIIGWGGESVPGESEVSVGGDEIAQANARAFMAKVPGSAEYQFMQNIESALSNVGLDRLQEMRENSPTGGALGQVPFQQQQRLEQVLGAFKITMPRSVMEENLKYMNNAYMDIMYGSEEEREALVQQGRLSPEQNQQIQQNYYNLNWNEFGRFEPPPEGFEIVE